MKKILIKLIRSYHKYFPHGIWGFVPLVANPGCRFQPSCSEYMTEAIEKYGTKGIYLGLKRLIHCHPLSSGGYDPLK